jgi:hypothetical protein
VASDQASRCGRRDATGGTYLAADDREFVNGTFQPRRRTLEQRLARRRRGLTYGGAAACQPGAAAGAAGVRAAGGIAVDDGDPAGVDTELFGRHLRDRYAHAGADVHLARVTR